MFSFCGGSDDSDDGATLSNKKRKAPAKKEKKEKKEKVKKPAAEEKVQETETKKVEKPPAPEPKIEYEYVEVPAPVEEMAPTGVIETQTSGIGIATSIDSLHSQDAIPFVELPEQAQESPTKGRKSAAPRTKRGKTITQKSTVVSEEIRLVVATSPLEQPSSMESVGEKAAEDKKSSSATPPSKRLSSIPSPAEKHEMGVSESPKQGHDIEITSSGQFGHFELINETDGEDRRLSSIFSTMSTPQRRELFERLRETLWKYRDAATSTSRLSGLEDTKCDEADKDRSLSSLLLCLSPEQQKELLKRLQENAENGKVTGTPTPTSFSPKTTNLEDPALNRGVSSFLLSLSQQQKWELLQRLRQDEDIGDGQEKATPSVGDRNKLGANEGRSLSTFLLSLSLEQQRELLERLRDEDARNKYNFFRHTDLNSQEEDMDSELTSLLSSLSPEQQRELLKRLREDEDARKRQEKATPTYSYFGHGDMNTLEADKDLKLSSFLLSLSPEQQREILKRLLEDEDVRMREEDKDRSLSSFLLSLSPEQQRKLLNRLREDEDTGKKSQKEVSPEYYPLSPNHLKDQEEDRDRRLSSFLLSLSPEQQRKLLELVRQDDNAKKSQGTLAANFDRFGQRDMNKFEAEKDRFSSFLSSLTPKQFEELLACLREHEGAGKKQYKPIPTFDIFRYGDVNNHELDKDRQLFSFPSDVTLKQQRSSLKSLQGDTGKGQDKALPKSSRLNNRSSIDDREETADRRFFVDSPLSQKQSESSPEGFRESQYATSSNSQVSSRSLYSDVGSRESATPTKTVPFLSNDNDVERRKAGTLASLFNGSHRESKESLTFTSRLSSPLSESDMESRESTVSTSKASSPFNDSDTEMEEPATSRSTYSTPTRASSIERERETARPSKLSTIMSVSEGEADEGEGEGPSPSKASFLPTNKAGYSMSTKDAAISAPGVSYLHYEDNSASKRSKVLIPSSAMSRQGTSTGKKRRETPAFLDANLPRMERPRQKAHLSAKQQTSQRFDTLKPLYGLEPAWRFTIGNNAPILVKYRSMNNGIILMPSSSGQKMNFTPRHHHPHDSRTNKPDHVVPSSRASMDVNANFSQPSPTPPSLLQHKEKEEEELDPRTKYFLPFPHHMHLVSRQKSSPYSLAISPQFRCLRKYLLTKSNYFCSSRCHHPSILRLQKRRSRYFHPACSGSNRIMLSDRRRWRVRRDRENADIMATHSCGDSHPTKGHCNSHAATARRTRHPSARSQSTTIQDLFGRHSSSFCQRCSDNYGDIVHADVPSASCDVSYRGFLPQVTKERALVCTEFSNKTYKYCRCLESSGSDSSIEEMRFKN